MQELQETQIQSLGQEGPLEEAMATHSSIPAWRIPWTEEPGGLQSKGLHWVGHDWSDLACTHHIYLSIPSMMEIWAASTFWQWITPLWTWVYKYLFETLLSLLLGINPEVQFLVQMVVLFLIFWGKHLTVSYGGCTTLRSDQQYTSVSGSLDPC